MASGGILIEAGSSRAESDGAPISGLAPDGVAGVIVAGPMFMVFVHASVKIDEGPKAEDM